MVELPDTAPQLEDLLRATDALLLEWKAARRAMEEEVQELVTWLFEPVRFDVTVHSAISLSGAIVARVCC